MITLLTILLLVNLLWPIAVLMLTLAVTYRLAQFVAIRLHRHYRNRIMLEKELKLILGDSYKVSYRNKRSN